MFSRIRFLAFVVLLVPCPGEASDGDVVLAEICEEGLAGRDAWAETPLAAAGSFSLPCFACDLLPQKYVGDGVRGDRPSPTLLRLSGVSALPAGKYRVLLRSRSAARLWINERLVVETPFPPKNGGDGSQHDTERKDALDLGIGYRFAPGGEYERIGECEIQSPPVKVRLEAFVGGREGKNPRRVELGETVVAVQAAGETAWHVLSPQGKGMAYTDADWAKYQSITHAAIRGLDAVARAALRAGSEASWRGRRENALNWLATTDDVPVPPLERGFPANNPVDHFIAKRFNEVLREQRLADGGTVDFIKEVEPLLEARCVECHRGPKAKGGLRLDAAALAREGGDSGPALIPGKGAESEMIRRITSHDGDEVMPPKGERLSAEETALLSRWIDEGAVWPEMSVVRRGFTAVADDAAFLRRVFLDVIGLPPTVEEQQSFLADADGGKRERVIDRLLADPRWADAWMPFWQDLLAENPNILNPTLNNSGPFRWWLHEAISDDLPLDRMVTQLIEQEGSVIAGGPAGFGMASQNDAPYAAKGSIVSAAFLGVEMKCARCHDSPAGSARQEQLFQLGAMLAGHPLDVPTTSSVDPEKLHAGGRKALIEVTLKPGIRVVPAWPFAELLEAPAGSANSRLDLAAWLTAPRNERFGRVMVNRIWARFMGRGLVEPMDDWEKGRATHPELLQWLARELVRGGYQMKPIVRLILTSAAYQRSVDASLRAPDPLYAAPEPRRLPAETVVDALTYGTGKDLRLEPLCLDLNGRREVDNAVDLGVPRRAWMLASLSNERDRPSLTLPRLQAVSDVLEALGWRGARQDPASIRDVAPNALQPAILAHGTFSTWLTRLSDDHPLTRLAIEAESPEGLVTALFARLICRAPNAEELARYGGYLRPDFESRHVPDAAPPVPRHEVRCFVTWTNHLLPEASTAKEQIAAEARRGDPPTSRLTTAWRLRCEDVIWALINAPEMLYRP